MKRFLAAMLAFVMLFLVSCEGVYTPPVTPPSDPCPPHRDADNSGVCDKCGAALYTRADDNAETVKNRLQTYHDLTEPIAEYYAAQGKLIRVDGQGRLEDITARVFEALERFEV